MDKDEKQFRRLVNFFDELIAKLTVEDVKDEQSYNGDCSCCFLNGKGFFVAYRWHDGEIAQLFICNVCEKTCLPEEPCRLSGCSFEETYKIYVANKNTKPS